MPQRGKLRVNTWVRVECRRVGRPPYTALLAERARSSGSTLRMAVVTAIARSAPRTPQCRCSDQVLLIQAR